MEREMQLGPDLLGVLSKSTPGSQVKIGLPYEILYLAVSRSKMVASNARETVIPHWS